jgi:hypothetical protein
LALNKLLLLALALLGACSKPEPAPRRTEPWLAEPSASSRASSTAPRRYRITRESQVTFSLPARKGNPRGRVPVERGELELSLADLKSARGFVECDLSRIEIDTSSVPEAALLGTDSPSALGLAWLELGPGVPEEKRTQYRVARFELSQVEPASPSFDPRARKASAVRASVVGTLQVHGFRAPVKTEVVLSGRDQLSIRSVGAFVVPLAPHDITARGPTGVVDAVAMARSADWVGKSARIEVVLSWEPVDK